MDPNKKRVSFSHIALPKHFRAVSSDNSSINSTDSPLSSELDPSTEDLHGRTATPSTPNTGPPSFKAVESYHISLSSVNSSNPSPGSSTIRSASPEGNNNYEDQPEINPFKFQETRRRSHAFSVSAIDETLPVNMDGEEYYSEDPEGSDVGGRSGGDRFDSVNNGGSNCSSPNKAHQPNGVKMFRAAEIPLGSRNRVLLCLTTNEIVANKSFQHEVRALRDLDWFLSRPSVLLDCDCSSVEVIIDSMLAVFQQALPEDVLNEARAQLYAANNAAFHLSNVIQNIHLTEDGQYLHDPSWLCTYASVSQLQHRRVVIARLKRPTCFGPTLRSVQFIILVLVPTFEKASKRAFEVARTFSTLFSESALRIALHTASDEDRFCSILEQRVANIKSYKNIFKANLPDEYAATGEGLEKGRGKGGGGSKGHPDEEDEDDPVKPRFKFSFCKGLIENFTRRLKYYPSDFIDGFTGERTWVKVPAATLTLFFACILPCVAFGVVNQKNTGALMGPKEALLGQAIGGLVFAFFAGQPLVIIATTAPLCLYTQIVYRIAESLEVDFLDLFAAVGLWNGFFLLLYVLFDLSQLMVYCTRSIEEIFATFIFFAFIVDGLNLCVESFTENYCFPSDVFSSSSNISVEELIREAAQCAPERSIVFVLLMCGTLIAALLLYNFSTTPYLSSLLRETLADYALPLSVIVFSLIGSFAFASVQPDSFEVSADYRWNFATLHSLTPAAILLSAVLGFALSILFFIDQNVSAALVSTPSNRLTKGDAYHWDLLVVGLLNIFLSLFGLPWMHGILPHSPMHARALADVVPLTDANNSGAVKRFAVLRVRETRVTGISIHVLIALVVTLWPALFNAVPVAVLAGLFLYCAANTLRDNSLYQRTLLLITEQASYPPTHYLRYCPQKTVHLFTAVQVGQLAIICFFGFAPWQYVQLVFPLIIGLLIPIRWFLLPRFTDEKYLTIIDSKHC